MSRPDSSAYAAALLALFFFNEGYHRLRRDLHMLQLNSYRNERYARWLSRNLHLYLAPRYLLPLLPLLGLPRMPPAAMALLACALLAGLQLTRTRPQEKKPLVVTARVSRLFSGTGAMVLVLLAVCMALVPAGRAPAAAVAVMLLLLATSPLVTVAGNTVMWPVESALALWYVRQARQRIASMRNLRVVGITGSFGKTSAKNILNAVLSEKFSCLMTPASFNTPLGVTRTIRESLRPVHEVFLAEMGAREPGNIRELCELVDPTIGVVTAVGEQHLETFGNIETVFRTKAELVQHLPADGLAVLNGDNPWTARMRDLARCPVVTFGIDGDALDYRAGDIRITGDGTLFGLSIAGAAPLEVSIRLLGRHNVLNALAAIAVADRMGVPHPSILAALRKLEPIAHRMAVSRKPPGITIIDDAYSSNVVGFVEALHVLRAMPGSRKILITPGLVELGADHESRHFELGRKAAGFCDLVVLVGPRQTAALLSGLQQAGFDPARLHVAADFKSASAFVRDLIQPGDVLLYENDLPDNFEEARVTP